MAPRATWKGHLEIAQLVGHVAPHAAASAAERVARHHIIDSRRGKFQPERFEDRYDDALAALVKAMAEGKASPEPKPPAAAKPIDLMEALRKSAAAKPNAKPPTKRAASRRKAG